MPWLFLLLALAAFWAALVSMSTWIMLLCLLVSLALFIAWGVGLYSARAETRHESQMIDPVELHQLREQAKARKAGHSSNSGTDGSGTDIPPAP